MKRIHFTPIAIATIVFVGHIAVDLTMTSKIASQIQDQLPKATGVSASIPLVDVIQNVTTDSIKSLTINIGNYSLKGGDTDVFLEIKASQINKDKPTKAKSLEITATIPASTILNNAQFESAEIVGNAIQIAIGPGGLGQALLEPRYSNNQIYFQVKSFSIFGNEVPASSLPIDIQSQIKSKSLRTLDFPKEMKVKSASMSPRGLSLKLVGKNIQLGSLGPSLQEKE
jgi:hypothetical protein